MSEIPAYEVIKSIGTFSDETAFKHKYMNIMEQMIHRCKTVLAIENGVEPGMPDLILVDRKDRSSFIETKYAKKGVITFKKSQLPWYRRHHKNIPIIILAYNDLTGNVHRISAKYILMKAESLYFKLADESNFELQESL